MLFALTFAACHGSNLIPGLMKRAQLQPVVDKWKAASKNQVDDFRKAAKRTVDNAHSDMKTLANGIAAGEFAASEGANLIPVVGWLAGPATTMGSAIAATIGFNKKSSDAYKAAAKKIFDVHTATGELADMVKRFDPSLAAPKAAAKGNSKRRKLGAMMGAPAPLRTLQTALQAHAGTPSAMGSPMSAPTPTGGQSPSPFFPKSESAPTLRVPGSPAEEYTIGTPDASPVQTPRSLTGSPVNAPDSAALPEGAPEGGLSPTGSTATSDDAVSAISRNLSQESLSSYTSCVDGVEAVTPLGEAGVVATLEEAPQMGAAESSCWMPGVGPILMTSVIRYTTGTANDKAAAVLTTQILAFYDNFDAAIDKQAELFLNRYAPL